MKKLEDKKWKTSDFYSAVIVKSTGIPLSSIEKENERFVTFVFSEKSSTCDTLLAKHWQGNLSINSRVFVENIKELKTRLYEKVRDTKYATTSD